MAHNIWEKMAIRYAEGELIRPLAALLVWHTRSCERCCRVVKRELALLSQLDQVLLQPQEIARTAAAVTRLQTAAQKVNRRRIAALPVAVAFSLVVAVGGMQLQQVWPGNSAKGAIVYVSSSHGVAVVGEAEEHTVIDVGVFASDS